MPSGKADTTLLKCLTVARRKVIRLPCMPVTLRPNAYFPGVACSRELSNALKYIHMIKTPIAKFTWWTYWAGNSIAKSLVAPKLGNQSSPQSMRIANVRRQKPPYRVCRVTISIGLLRNQIFACAIESGREFTIWHNSMPSRRNSIRSSIRSPHLDASYPHFSGHSSNCPSLQPCSLDVARTADARSHRLVHTGLQTARTLA
jgi:hypothetical protein